MARSRGLLGRGAKRARPLAMAVGLSARNAEREVGITVVDIGDRAGAEAIARATGAPLRAPVPNDLVLTALPHDAGPDTIAHLAAHRRMGGDVLIAVGGAAAQRRRGLRLVADTPDLGIACGVAVSGLDEAGLYGFRRFVVRRLGIRAVPGARSAPGLVGPAEDHLTAGASRRAAIVATLPSSQATMPLLMALQVRLAADVSALAGGRPGPTQGGVLAGIALSAPVWRQVSRTIQSAAPGIAPAARAGIAYGVTRGVGLVAARTRSTATTSSEEDS